jgi:folate-binding protein YgfZ
MAETVCQRLTVFRFRSDVSLEVADSNWACLIINTDDDLDRLEKLGLKPEQALNSCRIARGLIAVNVGIEEACVELMGFSSDLEEAGLSNTAPADDLRAAKIRAGIPEITEDYSEKFTPHMLNLDLLGAISFEKGCYTGQEVVARTQNLGKSKRRLMRYRSNATLTIGDKLSDGDRDVGEVINVIENDLLAVTPVGIHDSTLSADGVEVVPHLLPYLS